jgi:opacity protein-like surface antigen
LFFLAGEAKGDEFKLVPSFGLREEYNDNLFFTKEGKIGDFVTTLSPGLEMSNRTERLDFNLSGHVRGLLYTRNEDLNAIDYDGRGRLLYALDPNLNFSAHGELRRDSTPGQVLEPTGLVTSVTTYYKYLIGSGLDYAWTEKTKTSLSYSYTRYDYDYSQPGLLNSTTEVHDVSLGFIHDLSQYFLNTAGRVSLGYSRYLYRNTTVQYCYGTIGANRALNEKWTLLLDVGPSYTRSEVQLEGLTIREKVTQEGTGFFGQATLSYKGEKSTGDLAFSHRLMPGSGTVGVTENTSLTLGLSHRFTYELSGRLSTGVYRNKADRGQYSIVGVNQITFNVTPGIRYEFTKDFAVEASYSYSWVKDKLADTERSRNLLMINFIIQYPFVK